MTSQSWTSGLTGYFAYILFIATLGPLLFGFHLVDDDAFQTNPTY